MACQENPAWIKNMQDKVQVLFVEKEKLDLSYGVDR